MRIFLRVPVSVVRPGVWKSVQTERREYSIFVPSKLLLDYGMVFRSRRFGDPVVSSDQRTYGYQHGDALTFVSAARTYVVPRQTSEGSHFSDRHGFCDRVGHFCHGSGQHFWALRQPRPGHSVHDTARMVGDEEATRSASHSLVWRFFHLHLWHHHYVRLQLRCGKRYFKIVDIFF